MSKANSHNADVSQSDALSSSLAGMTLSNGSRSNGKAGRKKKEEDTWDDWEAAVDRGLEPTLKVADEKSKSILPVVIKEDADFCPPPDALVKPKKMQILKRPTSGGAQESRADTKENDQSSPVEKSVVDGLPGTTKHKTTAEREAEYAAARLRIFGSLENTDTSVSSSTSSLPTLSISSADLAAGADRSSTKYRHNGPRASEDRQSPSFVGKAEFVSSQRHHGYPPSSYYQPTPDMLDAQPSEEAHLWRRHTSARPFTPEAGYPSGDFVPYHMYDGVASPDAFSPPGNYPPSYGAPMPPFSGLSGGRPSYPATAYAQPYQKHRGGSFPSKNAAAKKERARRNNAA